MRQGAAPTGGKFEAPAQGQQVYIYGSALTLVLACLLIFNHFGRPFEKVLVGFKIPAMLCVTVILVVLLRGGIRGLKTRIGLPLAAFVGWMILITPLSSWRSGSVSYVGWYVALHVSMFLILLMAASNFQGLKKLFYMVIAGCALNIIYGGDFSGERFNLKSGMFGNSDDVALLAGFAAPFALFMAMQLPYMIFRVLVAVPAFGFLIYCIGLTATRAAVLGLAAMALVYLWRVSMLQRVIVLILCLAGFVTMLAVLPESVLNRFSTITDSLDIESARMQASESEAMASLTDRHDLLMDGIAMTLTSPIWGVGPGQYPQYRGTNYKYFNGRPKRMVPSHNTYIQISSENGIPGIIFYLVFLAMIHKTIRNCYAYNKPNAHARWQLGYQMSVCLEASYIYFVVCAIFMTCDQHPHQFVLAGLALAVEQMSLAAIQRQKATTTATPSPAPQPGPARSFPQPRFAT